MKILSLFPNVIEHNSSKSRVLRLDSNFFILAVSYNEPKFCPSATWNSDPRTFANRTVIGLAPLGLFVDRNNTIFAVDKQNGRIQCWFNGSTSPTHTVDASVSGSVAIYVTADSDVYLSYFTGWPTARYVYKWTLKSNATNVTTVMSIPLSCFGIFVDITNTLYCSMTNGHKVAKRWLDDSVTNLTSIAGTGFSGNISDALNEPHGIFVDTNFDLYVADSMNNRIQFFRSGQTNGTTVAGTGSSFSTLTLDYPTAVILDADKNLFIADCGSIRIVRWGRNGPRCLTGCSAVASSAPSRSSNPWSLNFDSYGNLFFSDWQNSRIGKLLVLNNSCGQYRTNSVNMRLV